VDSRRGFKENVIMGHIIPAGTGFNNHRKVSLQLQGGLEEVVDDQSLGDVDNAPLLA